MRIKRQIKNDPEVIVISDDDNPVIKNTVNIPSAIVHPLERCVKAGGKENMDPTTAKDATKISPNKPDAGSCVVSRSDLKFISSSDKSSDLYASKSKSEYSLSASWSCPRISKSESKTNTNFQSESKTNTNFQSDSHISVSESKTNKSDSGTFQSHSKSTIPRQDSSSNSTSRHLIEKITNRIEEVKKSIDSSGVCQNIKSSKSVSVSVSSSGGATKQPIATSKSDTSFTQSSKGQTVSSKQSTSFTQHSKGQTVSSKQSLATCNSDTSFTQSSKGQTVSSNKLLPPSYFQAIPHYSSKAVTATKYNTSTVYSQYNNTSSQLISTGQHSPVHYSHSRLHQGTHLTPSYPSSTYSQYNNTSSQLIGTGQHSPVHYSHSRLHQGTHLTPSYPSSAYSQYNNTSSQLISTGQHNPVHGSHAHSNHYLHHQGTHLTPSYPSGASRIVNAHPSGGQTRPCYSYQSSFNNDGSHQVFTNELHSAHGYEAPPLSKWNYLLPPPFSYPIAPQKMGLYTNHYNHR